MLGHLNREAAGNAALLDSTHALQILTLRMQAPSQRASPTRISLQTHLHIWQHAHIHVRQFFVRLRVCLVPSGMPWQYVDAVWRAARLRVRQRVRKAVHNAQDGRDIAHGEC